jgi:hypothetical protein
MPVPTAPIVPLWSNRAPVRPPRRQVRCHLDPHTRTKLVELRLTAKWTYPQIHKEYPNIPLSTIRNTVNMHQKRGYTNESLPGRGRKRILSEEELDLYMGRPMGQNSNIRPMGFLGGPWAGPFGPFSPQICINYMQDIQYY